MLIVVSVNEIEILYQAPGVGGYFKHFWRVEGGFVIERGLIDFAETQYIGNAVNFQANQ